MAVWFARRASQDINANDGSTWNDKADGTGNWLTWASLGASDVLCANGNSSITINVSVTCGRISTAAEVGSSDTGTAGGGFLVSGSSALTITANILAGSSICITSTHTGTGANAVSIVAPGGSTYVLTGGSSEDASAYRNNSSGTVNITGNVKGGSASYAVGVRNNSSGTVNITGNVAAGTSGGYGVQNESTGTLNVTGDVTSGASGAVIGIIASGNGAINVTGDITASPYEASVIYIQNSGVLTVTDGVLTAGANKNAICVTSLDKAITLIRCRVINSTKAHAIAGPAYYRPDSDAYIQYPYDADTHRNFTLPPAAADVQTGVSAGWSAADAEIVGTLTLPDVGDVEKDVDYGGDGDEFTGTFVVPAEEDVEDGVTYGAGGTEFEGTLAAGGGADLPDVMTIGA